MFNFIQIATSFSYSVLFNSWGMCGIFTVENYGKSSVDETFHLDPHAENRRGPNLIKGGLILDLGQGSDISCNEIQSEVEFVLQFLPFLLFKEKWGFSPMVNPCKKSHRNFY